MYIKLAVVVLCLLMVVPVWGQTIIYGDRDIRGNITKVHVIYMLEQADADADVAGLGQLWINTATPNELWFTDDAGTDVQLGQSGGMANVVEDVSPQLGADLECQGFNLQNVGVIFLLEQAEADADVAGEGQIWVNTATPNELWWTDDAGTDTQLGAAGAHANTITWTGTPVLESAGAFTFGDASDATVTITFANTGTDVSIAYTTAAMAVTGALTATNLSGTNTGDEVVADLTTSGTIEIATGTETNTGTDATRAVSPDGLDDWTGSTQVTTTGTITSGVWNGTDIADADVADDITIDLATLATTVTITDNESTAETNALIFTAGGDIDGGNLGLESDGDATYTPSTGTITATEFVGGGVGLTAVCLSDSTNCDTTPALGTPSALVLTNATGTLAGTVDLTAGMVDPGDYAADSIDHDDLNDTITFEDGSLLDFGTNISDATEGIFLPAHATTCASATAEGQVCWEEDAENLWIGNGSAAVQMNGAAPATEVRSIMWNAGAMDADGTNCADPVQTQLNSGPRKPVIICTDNDGSIIQGDAPMPDSYNGGTVTFRLEVMSDNATPADEFHVDFAVQCRGNSDVVNNTYGSEVAADVDFDASGTCGGSACVTWEQAFLTTTAVTGDGTCAGGDHLYWQGSVDASGTTATVADVLILSVLMEYTSTIGDD